MFDLCLRESHPGQAGPACTVCVRVCARVWHHDFTHAECMLGSSLSGRQGAGAGPCAGSLDQRLHRKGRTRRGSGLAVCCLEAGTDEQEGPSWIVVYSPHRSRVQTPNRKPVNVRAMQLCLR